MIGEIYTSVTPFYNSMKKENSYKKRPVLIIGGPRNNDYTVLPISTVKNRDNLDMEYDVEIAPEKYPLLNLMQLSYVRTHKQITVHRAALTSQIGDLKNNYEELYLKVLERLETFNKKILDDAL